jgi:hypothetical protein
MAKANLVPSAPHPSLYKVNLFIYMMFSTSGRAGGHWGGLRSNDRKRV